MEWVAISYSGHKEWGGGAGSDKDVLKLYDSENSKKKKKKKLNCLFSMEALWYVNFISIKLSEKNDGLGD